MKIELFEIFLLNIVKWYCDLHNLTENDFYKRNDFSKLKIIKLHFFACSTSPKALDLFNRFYAMPLGHVESDIYSQLHLMKNFSVDNDKLSKLQNFVYPQVSEDDNATVIKSVENLKSINQIIVNYNPFDLVDLSHRWSSWTLVFSEAKQAGAYSKQIPRQIIDQETKYYNF